jgi:hypothetical protein
MKIYSLIILTLIINPAMANSVHNCLPDSNLRYEQTFYKGLDRIEMVHSAITEFKKVFGPYVKERMGKDLIVINKWEEARVNAHATKDDLSNPMIIINGGMVRHPDMKIEGIYFILCHELGHFFGGAPKQFRGRSEVRSWSSAEGQADYFAATKCLPKIFSHLDRSGYPDNLQADPSSQKEVDKICSDRTCSKILLAGLSATKVFASLKPWWSIPQFETPDNSSIGITNLSHPDPQCRLDTIVSGSFCENREEDFHPTDPSIGACTKTDLLSKLQGSRPRCWYKRD